METLELQLERAKLADAHEIVTLVNSAYRGESSKKGWTTEADLLGGQRTDVDKIVEMIEDKNSVILLCRQDQNLAACVYLSLREGGNSREAYLGMLTVSPELQASGLGRKVLAGAEVFAQKHWQTSAMIMTVITLRAELLAWYERRGYVRTGKLEKFPYGDERFGLPKRQDLQFEVLRKLF